MEPPSSPSKRHLFSLEIPEETCFLANLGLCDRASTPHRFASPTWLLRTALTEEERLAVRAHALCEYHSCHPEYVPHRKRVKVSQDPPSPHSFAIPAPVFVPVVEKRTVSTSSQTDTILPLAPTPKIPCVGINNPGLEAFIEFRFGKCVPDEEGYPLGEKLKGGSSFRARHCTGESRSEKATRCDACQSFFLSMSSTRSRSETSERKGTQKFTPLSALRASPHVISLLNSFREESKKQKSPPPPPLEQSEDDIEVDSDADNDYLIKVLLTTLKKCEKLKGTFMGTPPFRTTTPMPQRD